MTTAAIVINSTVGNKIDTYASLSSTVTLENDDNTGVTSWLWELISKPPGSSAVLSGSTVASPNFIADKIGSYLIELKVNGGGTVLLEDKKIYGIKTKFLQHRLPSGYETDETTDGWADEIQKSILRTDLSFGDAIVMVCKNTSGSTINKNDFIEITTDNAYGIGLVQLVNIDGMGRPQETENRGFVISDIDGLDTVANNSYCLCCMFGVVVNTSILGVHGGGFGSPVSLTDVDGKVRYADPDLYHKDFAIGWATPNNTFLKQPATLLTAGAQQKETVEVENNVSPYETYLNAVDHRDVFIKAISDTNENLISLPYLTQHYHDGFVARIKNSGSNDLKIAPWFRLYSTGVQIRDTGTDYIVVKKTDLHLYLEQDALANGYFEVADAGLTNNQLVQIAITGIYETNISGYPTGTDYWRFDLKSGVFSPAIDTSWKLVRIQVGDSIDGPTAVDNYVPYGADSYVEYRFTCNAASDNNWDRISGENFLSSTSNYVCVKASGGDYSTLSAAITSEGVANYLVVGTISESQNVSIPNDANVNFLDATINLSAGYRLGWGDNCILSGQLKVVGDGDATNRYLILVTSNNWDTSNLTLRVDVTSTSGGSSGNFRPVYIYSCLDVICGWIVVESISFTGNTFAPIITIDDITNSKFKFAVYGIGINGTQDLFGLRASNSSQNVIETNIRSVLNPGAGTGYGVRIEATATSNVFRGISLSNDTNLSNLGASNNLAGLLS